MQISINRLELTAEQTEEKYDVKEAISPQVMADTGTDTGSDTENNSTEEVEIILDGDMTEIISSEETSENPDDGAEQISTEQTLPAITDGNPTYYTVKYGDTLSSIALTVYGSTIYASDIAKANNMEVDDRIFEGQEIMLPSVTPR